MFTRIGNLFLRWGGGVARTPGTTYFVANDGSDNYSGKSTSTPWKTIAKVNATTFVPGDQIRFKGGHEWKEWLYWPSSGSEVYPIIIDSYSSGNKPIISGLDTSTRWKTNGTWINSSTNIWYCSMSSSPQRLFANGTEFRILNSPVLNASTWYWDDASLRLYIYSAIDPSLAFSTLEIPIRHSAAYFTNKSYVNVKNLDLRGGTTACLYMDGGTHHIVTELCNIGLYSPMGIYTENTNDSIIKNSSINSGRTYKNTWYTEGADITDGIKLFGGCNRNSIHNNTIINWLHDGITLKNLDDGVTLHDNNVYQNIITAPDIDAGRGLGAESHELNALRNKFFRNKIIHTSEWNQINMPSLLFYYNIIDDVSGSSSQSGGKFGGGLSIDGYPTTQANLMEVYNNTIMNCREPGIRLTHFAGWSDKQGNIFKNNLIYNCGLNPYLSELTNIQLHIYDGSTVLDNNYQNNLFYKGDVSNLIYYGHDTSGNYYYTVAQFNAKNGTAGDIISANITGNPSLNADYTLANNSPAINAGKDLYLTEDYYGNPILGLPDIGACERQPLTFYVSNSGNDASAGTSETTAWAHHPWMSTWTGTTTLIPGDIVSMKKGDTWVISNPSTHYMTVAQNGTETYHITTTAYGSGNKPLIKIDTSTNYSVIYANGKSHLIFDNLHIQHSSSEYNSSLLRTGFYLDGDTNPCHHILFTNNEIDNIPFIGIYGVTNCYNITIGDITVFTISTSTGYSNHIYNFGYAGILLQGVNPNNNISNNYVYYNYIHDGTQTVQGENEYGIAFSASVSSTSWPSYCYARYNRVENLNTWEAMDCHAGSYIYFTDNYIKNFGTNGILLSGMNGASYPNFKGDHQYAERNIIEQSASKTGTGAFIQQTSSSENETDIYIRDNSIFYTTRPTTSEFFGIRIGFVDGITVSGNKIYNGPTTADYDAIYISTTATGYKNITIENNFIHQWGNSININGGSDLLGLLTIRNNIIIDPPKSCIRLTADALSASALLDIYNNTLLTNYTYCLEMNKGTTAGSIVNIKNNIIGRTTAGTLYYIYWEPTVSGTMNIDYNQYWNSNNGYFDWGAARNWTYWTGTLGFDTHSPNTSGSLDPSFNNASGLYSLDTDFTLNVDSSAINAGTDVSLLTDYFGNSIVGIPDIGACESSYAYSESVVTGTKYYVKTNGSDNQSGLSDASAWKTIAKVKNRLYYLNPGDGVLFRKGDTFDGSLNVSEENNAAGGIDGSVKVIGSYGYSNEKPIINGFQILSSWTSYDGSVYYATVSLDSSIELVTLDGSIYDMGMWPNKGSYQYIQSHVAHTSISDSSLNSAVTNWTGAELVMRMNEWTSGRYKITNHDGSTLSITTVLSTFDSYNIQDGWGYFIQNSLKTLTNFGEWYHDVSTKRLYMYFGANSPSSYIIKVPNVKDLIFARWHTGEYITFDNLSLMGANNNIISISDTNTGITIKNCDLNYSGRRGIDVLDCSRFTCTSTNINNCNEVGIMFYNVKDSCIHSCIVTNSGMNQGLGLYGFGSHTGILTQGDSTRTNIKNNIVRNSGYSGILFRGSNVTIKNNFVDTFCYNLCDGAGIYYGGEDAFGNFNIEENIVLNGIGAAGGQPLDNGATAAHGIYLDDNTVNGVVIVNNTIANCTASATGGIFIHDDKNVNINNNTSYNNTFQILYSGGVIGITDISMNNNKFIARDPSQLTMWIRTSGTTDVSEFGNFNYNYYARPMNDVSTIVVNITSWNYTGPQISLTNWKSLSGMDANSQQSPVSCSSTGDILFYYNASTGVNKTITLPAGTYVDVSGTSYSGNVILTPWTSKVFIKT
jgi:hypothetical protein